MKSDCHKSQEITLLPPPWMEFSESTAFQTYIE